MASWEPEQPADRRAEATEVCELARARFDDLHGRVQDRGGDSVNVGFSELRDRDTADEFIKRSDRDLLKSWSAR